MSTATLQNRFIKLRSNKLFELTEVLVIISSALLVGAKTYALPPAAEMLLGWLDHLITAFFITELTVRFLAEENKGRFFHNAWNVFDTLIVTISLLPIPESVT